MYVMVVVGYGMGFVEYVFVLDYIEKKGEVYWLDKDEVQNYCGNLGVFVFVVELCFGVRKLIKLGSLSGCGGYRCYFGFCVKR